MICPNCTSYVSGAYCKVCGKVLLETPKKKAGIPKQSEKMKKILAEYKEKRKKFLEDYPFCAVFPMLKATEIHHAAGKLGDVLYLDENYWFPVSRKGHDKIEANPDWAKEQGYSVSRIATKEKNDI